MMHQDTDVDDRAEAFYAQHAVKQIQDWKNKEEVEKPILCSSPLPMKWVRWKKTQAEVFGLGTEAWCEGWAWSFVFGDKAFARQDYLWNLLCQNKHRQAGMGVSKIPGVWKQRARAKRRTKLGRGVLSSGIQSHDDTAVSNFHGHCRGGGMFDNSVIELEAQETDSVEMQSTSDCTGAAVHTFCFSDFNAHHDTMPLQDYVSVKADNYEIVIKDDEQQIPEYIRAVVGAAAALETEGLHCACAVHSVFGKPSKNGKLSVVGARELAQRLLSSAPEDANAQVADLVKGMHQTFWEEFVLRHCRQQDTAESELFWKALVENAGSVAQDCERKYLQYCNKLQTVTNVKKEAVRKCRLMFTDRNAAFTHQVAVALGYIDENRNSPESSGYEGEALVCGSDGYIRGMKRIPFPGNRSMHKYDALFLQDDRFDALRESFLIYGDGKPQRCLTSVEHILETIANPPSDILDFVVALRAWVRSEDVDEKPPVTFQYAAWNAYLKCIQSDRYFFSISEVALMCRIARVNVAIFKQLGSVLTYVDGHSEFPGAMVYIKLLANNEGEVHSHFERILCHKELREFYAQRDTARKACVKKSEKFGAAFVPEVSPEEIRDDLKAEFVTLLVKVKASDVAVLESYMTENFESTWRALPQFCHKTLDKITLRKDFMLNRYHGLLKSWLETKESNEVESVADIQIHIHTYIYAFLTQSHY